MDAGKVFATFTQGYTLNGEKYFLSSAEAAAREVCRNCFGVHTGPQGTSSYFSPIGGL
jgi:hypothetical protein